MTPHDPRTHIPSWRPPLVPPPDPPDLDLRRPAGRAVLDGQEIPYRGVPASSVTWPTRGQLINELDGIACLLAAAKWGIEGAGDPTVPLTEAVRYAVETRDGFIDDLERLEAHLRDVYATLAPRDGTTWAQRGREAYDALALLHDPNGDT